MAYFCSCNKCKASPAKPKSGTKSPIEEVSGFKVNMIEGWVLVHWSGAKFEQMFSTEVHNFKTRGNHMVGSSFFLCKHGIPAGIPKSLSLLGLGGSQKYTIDSEIGNQLEVYYKGNKTEIDTYPEVTVVLGCGGSIGFNDQNEAVSINPSLCVPIIKNKGIFRFLKFKRPKFRRLRGNNP
ncbi:hypothetical protein [Veronia pacifica]|uniref:Uncharacterized protein n=1 Tax=Veronia pacifica TaxID=1080227 RepID=A0A1C3EKP1_9GAMM|nr:hypothetical protein [Veronia pacifica]ODA33799.1 hypothetical protein A8L45_09220 [Veronia pacifica]